jgi:two-component system response regulator AtoC
MDATLLLCDYQSPSRDAVERFFSQCGFRVETAHDGLECLNKVRSLEPDVLVADLETPWGGAAAVVAFLHESCFEFEIPVVLIVGNSPPQILSQRTNVPESLCFQKPLRMENLLDRVGLAIAVIDLRRNGHPRLDGRWPGRPDRAETCLT